jgi:hypothetical protein
MNYYEYQQAVFNHLWSRYETDKNFRFSVRQKASKGAEKNHFIGKENSGYFGFTFWDTPVYYPGSAADLTDFIFRGADNDLHFLFQFGTSKAATGEQNEGDLELGYELLKEFDTAGIKYLKSPDENKMLYYTVDFNPQGYSNISDLLKGFDESYSVLAPLIDKAIETINGKRPNWQGGRYEEQKFLRLIEKMHERIEEYSRENKVILIDDIGNGSDSDSGLKSVEVSSQPLNRILYGPPGTGKTYHTIDKALQIIDPKFYEANKSNRIALTQRFRSLSIRDWAETKGQIAFVTFHQSMSYEDFVEGIKPLKPKPGEKLSYDIEDGIFKLLCKLARSNYESALKKTRLLPFEEAFEKFKQDWEDNPNQKFPLKTQGYDFTVIGFTNSSIQFKKSNGGTGHTLSINTLKEQYYGKEYDFKQGVGIYYPAILNKVRSYSNEQSKKIPSLNYVLIIDEINRGNISQIFGELITLIEPDKRIGNEESIEVLLPYSKEAFGVPPNLYLIGTMNTADRSVEALDTALRRRFSFEEISPDPILLNNHQMLLNLWWKYREDFNDDPKWIDAEKAFNSLYDMSVLDSQTYDDMGVSQDGDSAEELSNLKAEDFAGIVTFDNEGVKLDVLLTKMNRRLEKLLSKDHQIGHAFFISVFSVEDLYNAFYQKLIPQLQEYFYGDFGKMGLVLGSDFVKSSEEDDKFSFASFVYEDAESLLEKPIYRVEEFIRKGVVDYAKFLSAVKNIYK